MASPRSALREYLEALLIAVIFAAFARTWVVQAFKIPTGSMRQSLLVGDHILVNKFVYGPRVSSLERWLLPMRPVRRGDVVVFKYPEDPSRDFIKRCVGLPGDSIEIVDKTLLINGRAVDDRAYAYHADVNVYPRSAFLPDSHALRDNFGPYVVPEHHYFCLGDNRDNSNDSRFWGTVPEAYLKGRALLIYWSFAGADEPPDSAALGRASPRFAGSFVAFFTRTRWDRAFHLVR